MTRKALSIVTLLLVSATPALAGEGHEIRGGAVALGAAGAFTSVEGSTAGSFGITAAYFLAARGLTLSLGAGWDYAHVSDLDLVEVGVSVAAMRRIGESSAYPFVALGGGVRQEWVGSFRQARYPLGFDVGLQALVSAAASFAVTYEFRRVLDDPVSDFSEHRVVVGLAVLFRNR